MQEIQAVNWLRVGRRLDRTWPVRDAQITYTLELAYQGTGPPLADLRHATHVGQKISMQGLQAGAGHTTEIATACQAIKTKPCNMCGPGKQSAGCGT